MRRMVCVVAGVLFAVCAISQAEERLERAVPDRPLEIRDEFEDNAKAPAALAKQIAEYNRLLKEKRLSQAAEISAAIFREHPNDPTARLMHEHTLLLQAMLDHGVDLGLTSSQREPVLVVYAVEGLLSPPRSGHDESDPDTEKLGEYLTLMQLIAARIAPKTWEPHGSGSMKPYVEDGRKALVVRQTLAVHNEIADLLKELGELNAATVSLNVQFIKGPTKLAEVDPGCQNPVKMKQQEARMLFAQPPKRWEVVYPGEVKGVTVKVPNGKSRSVPSPTLPELMLPQPLGLEVTPVVSSDWRKVRLTIVNERVPENQISVDLSSDECVAVEISRLSVPLPKTPVEAARREALLKSAPGTVMIITPTIEHH